MMDKKFEGIINNFLKVEGIECRMAIEDQFTRYWSYAISNPRMLGWISNYDCNGDSIFSASINFGILKQDSTAKATLALLEANSALRDGFSYATQVGSLVMVQVNNESKLLTPSRLRHQLQELHLLAYQSVDRFVNSEFQIENLPESWFISSVRGT